jgi:hypothetical protein
LVQLSQVLDAVVVGAELHQRQARQAGRGGEPVAGERQDAQEAQVLEPGDGGDLVAVQAQLLQEAVVREVANAGDGIVRQVRAAQQRAQPAVPCFVLRILVAHGHLVVEHLHQRVPAGVQRVQVRKRLQRLQRLERILRHTQLLQQAVVADQRQRGDARVLMCGRRPG